jgi:NADPH:quinone reductase
MRVLALPMTRVDGATLDSSFVAVKRYKGHVVSSLRWRTHSLAPLSFRGASYWAAFTLLPLITSQGRSHLGEILVRLSRREKS